MDNKVTELWAWVIQQPNGVEHIAMPKVFNETYPLVTSSEDLARLRMSNLAKGVARDTGYPTKLVKFVRTEE